MGPWPQWGTGMTEYLSVWKGDCEHIQHELGCRVLRLRIEQMQAVECQGERTVSGKSCSGSALGQPLGMVRFTRWLPWIERSS